MRILNIFILLVLGFACNTSKKSQMNTYELNGVWIPTKQEMNGTELPASVYSNFKLTMNDSSYVFGIAQEDKGVINYNKGKMDIYGKEGPNKGKHITAIYKLENAILTICYDLSGGSYPEAFETKSKPTLFLSVYNKEAVK